MMALKAKENVLCVQDAQTSQLFAKKEKSLQYEVNGIACWSFILYTFPIVTHFG